MEEQLISFETAKLAKEKGFDLDPRSGVKFFIDKNGGRIQTCFYPLGNYNDIKPANYEFSLFAPTQSLLQKWLRDKYQINCRVASNSTTCHFPMNGILDEDGELMRGPIPIMIYKTYEEALEAGLLDALKLIKI